MKKLENHLLEISCLAHVPTERFRSSSLYAKYICFIFSVYHSSVSDKQVGGEVCR